VKSIFQIGVYGNFWVALCAVAQGALTYRLIGESSSWSLLLILFLATFFVYNISVLLDYKLLVKNTNAFVSIRTQVISENATYLIWLIIAAAVLITPIAYLALKPLSIVVFGISGIISVAYFLPVLPSKKGLRQIPGLKSLIIALVWTVSTVLVPVIESGVVLDNIVLIRLLAERFLLVLVLALVADARDELVDRENRLATVVTYIGVQRVKYLCMLLLFVASLVNVQNIHASFIFYVLASAVVWYAFFNRKNMYHLFVVDGLTVVQFLVLELVLLIGLK
jgi:hypothetical protein